MSGPEKTPDLRDVVRHLLAIRTLLSLHLGMFLGAYLAWVTR